MEGEQKAKSKHPLKCFWNALGPGLISGAADDDPSGVATYSIAGAQFGTSLLWTAWLTWPLMAAVQMMCARIGMMTGKGLIGAFRNKFPKPVLLAISCALFTANSINIGANLAGMSDAAEVLSGIDSHFLVLLFGAGIGFAIVKLRYHQIASVLKWLALALFAYIITAILIKPDWGMVITEAFTPSLPASRMEWQTIVAILGTTISPYLFFWQASQEVEEEKALGRRMVILPDNKARKLLQDRMMDVGAGTFLANTVFFFIVLTTALTLNKNGITEISSSKEAALALRPLAGDAAMILYATGILAVGFLAIPTLAGSAAYAFAETFDWSHGLSEKLKQARAFYGVIIFSVLCGMAIEFTEINPIQALYFTAIINGILAPFLLTAIWLTARDKTIMAGRPSSRLNQAVVAITIIIMFAALLAMLFG